MASLQSKKTVLITGAGQGMGLGAAKQLAQAGHRVLLNDIDTERAESAVAAICEAGGDAIAAVFDITEREQVATAIADLQAACGGIDILINNAGNAGAGPMQQMAFREMPAAEWDKYIAVNLYGVLNCCKAVVDGMCERGWGRIIVVSSEAARSGLDIGVSIYGAAKAASAQFIRHLAREIGPQGVTANIISLGLMDNVPAEFSASLIKGIPMRRLGSSDDLAHAINYLIAEEAAWVSGQTLVVNGASQTN